MANPNEKGGKQGFFQKLWSGVKKLGPKTVKAFRDMIGELKRVSWPAKKSLMNYTLVVLAFMLVMGLIILGIDSLSGLLVQYITA